MDALFPRGNLDNWNIAITKYLPAAMQIITKTVDPVIQAALLALTGSTEEFSRDLGTVQFAYDDAAIPTAAAVELQYSVPSFKLQNASEEAVAHDRAFILAYMKQIESSAALTKLQIDIKTGKVVVAVNVQVGYQL